MSAAEKAQLDLGIFSAIMTYWNSDEIDANAIAQKNKTSQQKVAGMVFAAKNTPRAYNELVAAGADPGQVPPWFMRPNGEVAPSSTPNTPPSTPLTPPSTPKTEVVPREGEEIPPPGGGGNANLNKGAGASEVPPTSVNLDDASRGRIEGGNALGAVYDNVRLESQRLTALGIVRDADGRYIKAAVNPDGSPTFIEVDPAEALANVRQDVGAELSKAAIGDLNIHMRTVMRKIGLNPTVFMSYAWACSDKGFQGDLGDFCTQAIKYIRVR